jgi:hypothetical protein
MADMVLNQFCYDNDFYLRGEKDDDQKNLIDWDITIFNMEYSG